MNAGNVYDFSVEPQDVDFTLRATITSMCNCVLNTAGVDAQRNGFGTDTLLKNDRSWVLSRMALEFDILPEQYTPFKIRTWINDGGRLLSVRNFLLTDDGGNVFGRVTSQWCMIDMVRRAPLDLSSVVELHRSYVSDEPAPCDRPRKVLTVNPQHTTEHRIVYSDIDFNRHVNTMRYIDMMLDILPIEMLAEHRPLRLDVHFIRESRYGHTLTVGYEQNGDVSLFEIKSDDGEAVCRAAIEWR